MLSNVVIASCVVFFLPLTNGNNVVINEAAASAADRVLFSSVEALKGIFSVYSSSAMSNAGVVKYAIIHLPEKYRKKKQIHDNQKVKKNITIKIISKTA